MHSLQEEDYGDSLCLGSWNYYVEDVVSPNEYVTVVRTHLTALILRGMIHDDVHISVTLNHVTLIFQVVFQLHLDDIIDIFHKRLQWSSDRFHCKASNNDANMIS